MKKTARHSIPRGFRPTYTPCLDEECQDLLKQYEDSGDPDIADHLIESLDAARQHRWEELTSKMNFTHSGRLGACCPINTHVKAPGRNDWSDRTVWQHPASPPKKILLGSRRISWSGRIGVGGTSPPPVATPLVYSSTPLGHGCNI